MKRDRAMDLSSFHSSYCQLARRMRTAGVLIKEVRGSASTGGEDGEKESEWRIATLGPTSFTSSTNTMYSSACSWGFQMTACAADMLRRWVMEWHYGRE